MTATAAVAGFQVGTLAALDLEISMGTEPPGPGPQVLTLPDPRNARPCSGARLSGCLLANPGAQGVVGSELLTPGFHPRL